MHPTRTEFDTIIENVIGARLPGRPRQDILVESELQNYVVGSRLQLPAPDNRVFHYCKAGPYGVALPYWAAFDRNRYSNDDSLDCIEGVTIGAKVVGDTTLVVADATVAHIADFFQGGWVALTIDSIIQMYNIRSNTAAGTNVTITLDKPLAVDVAAGSQIQVFPSKYSVVDSAHPAVPGRGPKSIMVCVPTIVVPPEHYFWGQTWGACYGVGSWAAADFPSDSYETRLVFNSDGSVMLEPAITGLDIQQRAGYRLINYENTPPGYLIYYQLELEP